LFDFDKAQVKAAAMPKLRELRDFIKQRHPKQVQIHGHTDAIGGDAYNQRLSLRRADAVADWLAANGISRAVMVTRGFGERAPVAPNHKPDGSDDPEGRQKNRRVDVLLAKTFVPIRPIQLPR
jgi:photosystem I P700 chlorophyll a apoprotein A2